MQCPSGLDHSIMKRVVLLQLGALIGGLQALAKLRPFPKTTRTTQQTTAQLKTQTTKLGRQLLTLRSPPL